MLLGEISLCLTLYMIFYLSEGRKRSNSHPDDERLIEEGVVGRVIGVQLVG